MPEGLALYTTVYPGVERYLPAWYRSVQTQTDKNFDLWIAVDSLDSSRIMEELRAKPGSINFIAGEPGTPAQIRQHALDLIVNDYEAIVFVDSDDLLYPTRIEAARRELRNHDVVGCALRIIDEAGNDLWVTFGQTDGEPLHSLLPRYNVFGLSNTAYRCEVLKQCLPIENSCVLVDWALATRALAEGADLYFDQQPQMAYRQYAANVARVILPFTPDHVLTASRRVLGHYKYLLDTERPIRGLWGQALRQERERVKSFHQAIDEDSFVLKEYVDALNRKTPRYVWWWCVAHPELKHLWKN